MINRVSCFYILLICSISFFSACEKPVGQTEIIKGIYGTPNDLWKKGMRLDELGVNAVFVRGSSVNSDLIERARLEGAQVFVEFPTLNGKGYVEKHPEAWAIDEKGEKVEAASWFMGVCPTNQGFRQYRILQLKKLLNEHKIDGVWLDYVHWHAQFEDPEPILPETCFCDHCLTEFADQAKFVLPEGNTEEKAAWILNHEDKAWRDWRCQVIADWATQFKSIIKQMNPNTLLGLYHCPWNDQEFEGARRRILGLDYDLLKESIDVFSPMVYHRKMGRGPEWVEENLSWFNDRLMTRPYSYPKVWPIVQAHNDPGIISADEFETVLRGGLSGNSSGVMMFTSHSVAEDMMKVEVMKKVYHGAQR